MADIEVIACPVVREREMVCYEPCVTVGSPEERGGSPQEAQALQRGREMITEGVSGVRYTMQWCR